MIYFVFKMAIFALKMMNFGRVAGDELLYNSAAAALMAEEGVAVNPLHHLTVGFDASMFRGKGDVHYTNEGSRLIAEQVAGQVRAALALATHSRL